ncbi:lysylphosphatidylglycerol synthase domain-containing protein [Longispora sp. K20-0274]|uniref:lysylphosphatidylglycerol synthase domain-containing protein n=1 Tax=Longispora sp. K20-0274 TaxID=3088255 RepID=UPI003999C0D0
MTGRDATGRPRAGGAGRDEAGRPGSAVAEGRAAPWGRVLRVAVALVVLGAVGFALWTALHEDGPRVLDLFDRPGAVPLLLGACAANIAGLVLGMASWRALLADRIGPVAGARIFFLGQLSKYVPGRVWGVLTHVQLGKRLGVPASRMVGAYVVSLGVTTLTGAAVGLLVGPAVLGRQAYWLLAPAALVVACVLRPALLHRALVLAARLSRREEPAPAPGTRKALIVATVSWLVSGLHLWALLLLCGADPVAGLPVGVGAFALATVAGSLALILPDGWGVRELVLMAALATVVPWSVAGVVAVASRLVCVVCEVLTSLTALGWARLARTAEARNAERSTHVVEAV